MENDSGRTRIERFGDMEKLKKKFLKNLREHNE